jgi:hypothetical protein
LVEKYRWSQNALFVDIDLNKTRKYIERNRMKVLSAVVLLLSVFWSQISAAKSHHQPVSEGFYFHSGKHPAIDRGVKRGAVREHGELHSWRENDRLFVAMPSKRLNMGKVARYESRLFGTLSDREPRFSLQKTSVSMGFGWVVVYANCGVLENANFCSQDGIDACEAATWTSQAMHSAIWRMRNWEVPLSQCGGFAGMPVSGSMSNEEMACRYVWGGTNGIDPLGDNPAFQLDWFDDGYARIADEICTGGL